MNQSKNAIPAAAAYSNAIRTLVGTARGRNRSGTAPTTPGASSPTYSHSKSEISAQPERSRSSHLDCDRGFVITTAVPRSRSGPAAIVRPPGVKAEPVDRVHVPSRVQFLRTLPVASPIGCSGGLQATPSKFARCCPGCCPDVFGKKRGWPFPANPLLDGSPGRTRTSDPAVNAACSTS